MFAVALACVVIELRECWKCGKAAVQPTPTRVPRWTTVAAIPSAGSRCGERSRRGLGHLRRRNPNPKWVAPPGTSLHRYGTELDLGPPAAYAWLAANAGRFGFIHRYAWEPWHYGLPLAHK